MNKAIEIHDSTLSEILEEGTTIVVSLNKAIIHHSLGEPGIDEGSCWIQLIDIKLESAQLLNKPEDIPNNLYDGFFKINSTKHVNGVDIPLKESGEIEIFFETFYRNTLYIKAESIEIIEAGKAEYLQKFKVPNT